MPFENPRIFAGFGVGLCTNGNLFRGNIMTQIEDAEKCDLCIWFDQDLNHCRKYQLPVENGVLIYQNNVRIKRNGCLETEKRY